MADTPSPPSPEILEKLRQLREELAQKAAQQAPKDANTLAWQQSNAFKRIYPRAEGGAIHMENGGVFKEQVMPFVNRGLDNMFPLRQLMQRAYIKDLWDPVNSTMAQDIPAAVRNMNVTRQDANWGKHHMQNAARKSVGMDPLPERYFDAEKALGQINVNEFPNPDNPIKPKSARLWDDIFLNGDYKKASGGQVDIDRMRLELMGKGGSMSRKKRQAGLEKFLSDSQIKERLYHATPHEFSEFKPGGANPTMSGRAIWMSADPKRQPAAHNIHTKGSNYKQGVRVMPLHVKAKNPLVLDDPTMIEWAREVFAGGSKEFPELLPPHWINAVRKEGYDSIHFADPYGRGDPHEVIMFEPNKIKSAIGNRGTYDITNPDITKKNGGITHMRNGGNDLSKYRDPKATKIKDWKWRKMQDVRKDMPIIEVPDYVQKNYGEFMNQQLARAKAAGLTARDLLKAFTITQSSIGRGGLSHATATKTGMKLPNTGDEVRPEGAFAEWLGSPMGQSYLNAAERGMVHQPALNDIRQKFSPFGKHNQLTDQMIYAAQNMPAMAQNLNQAITGSQEDYRNFAEKMKGVAGAKSGFIGSMLGRGDLPTLDARQLNLHALPADVGIGSIMNRGKGQGAREAVDRLAARQAAMNLKIDPSMQSHYQHLAHHAIWDAAGNNQTTHNDIIKAMRGYKTGGITHAHQLEIEERPL